MRSIKRWHCYLPLVVSTTLGLAGCGSMPKSGPDSGSILNNGVLIQTASAATTTNAGPQSPYFVVDLSPSVLSYFEKSAQPLFSSSFGKGRTGAPTIRIGVGDSLAMTIFESGPGGLFSKAETSTGGTSSGGGSSITLPVQTVDSSGMISVPYAGRIKVAGMTPAAVQSQIEKRLADRAIEPQVVVSVPSSRSTEVSVLGDVKNPSSFSINPSGERVLDVLSKAGGTSGPAPESYITLQRRGTTATVLFSTLVKNPAENIYVFPGDTVYVDRDRRTYLAFGATGTNGRFDFEESDLTLAEAVAKASGVNDDRADPAEVFIYRFVPASTLASMGLAVSSQTGVYPVIIHANMRDPSMFFLAQRFLVQDKDIVYIDNASSVELSKVLKLISTATQGSIGLAANVRTLVR